MELYVNNYCYVVVISLTFHIYFPLMFQMTSPGDRIPAQLYWMRSTERADRDHQGDVEHSAAHHSTHSYVTLGHEHSDHWGGQLRCWASCCHEGGARNIGRYSQSWKSFSWHNLRNSVARLTIRDFIKGRYKVILADYGETNKHVESHNNMKE